MYGSAGVPDPSRRRYAPAQRGYYQLVNNDPEQAQLPAPTELNYDTPRWVIARPAYRGINFMAGFSQLGMLQSYHNAWLPPPVRVGPIQKVRNVGGVLGMGSISAGAVHIPGVLVPRTVG